MRARDRQRTERQRWNRFLTYWYGHLVSLIGDYLTLVALPLAAFKLSGSAVVTGAVEMVQVGGSILFGTALGTLADRSDARRVLIGCDLARAVMMGGLAALFALDMASWGEVLVVSFGLGTLRALHDGAEGVLLARLIPDDMEVRAFARLEAADSLGNLAGPTLGGSLAAIALAWSFSVDAVTFLIGAAMVILTTRDHSLLRAISEAPSAAASSTDATGASGPAGPAGPAAATATAEATADDHATFRYALRAIRAQPRYVQWVGAYASSNIAVVGFGALLIPFAERELKVGSVVIGLMVSASGIGGLIVTPWLDRQREVRLDHAAWSLVIIASVSILAGLVVSVVTVTIGMVAIGASYAVATSHSNAIRQQLFPPNLQGRVRLTTRTVMQLATLISILSGAAVSQYIGARWVFVVFGSIALVSIVAIGLIRTDVAPTRRPPGSGGAPSEPAQPG